MISRRQTLLIALAIDTFLIWGLYELVELPYRPPHDMTTLLGGQEKAFVSMLIGCLTLVGILLAVNLICSGLTRQPLSYFDRRTQRIGNQPMCEPSVEVPSPEEVVRRFAATSSRRDSHRPSYPLRCPCCGCLTLSARASYEICEVCFWEDDGQDDHDTDVVRGGPNGSLSLSHARTNYLRIGACEESMLDNVRSPGPSELP